MTRTSLADRPLDAARLAELRPGRSHGFSPAQVHDIMDGIFARGDRLMLWFLASHMVLALALAQYHDTWIQSFIFGGGALGAFVVVSRLWPRTFFTRALAGVAQQTFVALHIFQLYGQTEQHFWYFTALTMMIVYQDWVCMWPGALLIIAQHTIFAGLHNAGYPVHFFPEPHVGFTKLFYHFGIALVQVALCGYWSHLLRQQTLSDAWRKHQLGEDQRLLEDQLATIRSSERTLKATSDALAESSRRQRAILDNVPDAMWVKDVDGRYTNVNASFCRFFDRSVREIEGKTAADLLSPEASFVAAEQDARAMSTRRPVNMEHEVVDEGRFVVTDTIVSPVIDEQGTVIGTTGIARDITERKRHESERMRTEEQLRNAQKLESLGILAGGIAHEFNNLLAGILGNAELGHQLLPPESPAIPLCNEIQLSALRAAELTRQMLAYSGKGLLEARPLNLSLAVQQMSGSLRAGLAANIELRFDLAADLPLVEGDVIQVQKVLTSLVDNASEALTDRPGIISVRTERVDITARQLRHLQAHGELTEGTFAELEVSDTGHGMSIETRRKMFEPFFTTKFVGRGLGLPAVLGIVRGHHGAILTHSEPGAGTRIQVLFPALATPAAPKPAAARASGAHRVDDGKPLILVVDDERSIRTMVSRMLESSGFAVLAAADGVEAVAIVSHRGASIALVLLDMLMPKLGGVEAMRAIRELRPDLPILFSSGFSGATTIDRLGHPELVDFIQKPYRMDALIAAINSLLAAEPAGE